MADLKTYAIGTLSIALLISLGINVAPDSTHFCRNLSIGKYCARLSSTEKTCYPLQESNIGSRYCISSWEKLLGEEEKTDSIKVRANAGSYNCPCGEINSYTKCIKSDGKEAYIGELI